MKQTKTEQMAALARIFFSIVAILSGFLCQQTRAETDPKFYAVEVSANIQITPAQITLVWPADPRATSYKIYRKSLSASSWTPVTSLQGNATSFADNSVSVGSAYEYQITKSTSYGYQGFGYIFAGIKAPLIENRGKLVLIVENTYAAELAPELSRLEQDLIGDGWTVLRHDVSRNDSSPRVKSLIQADYQSDRSSVRAVFLFGHVPVPYSGSFGPDNHGEHQGAWPADAYYGDMDGNWTDSSVSNTSAARPKNWNVPGDGKFDQSYLPSDVELEVGRVDLDNMTCFANKSPWRSEKDLLRQYLNKDHNFRHRLIQVPRRGLVCDNFGEKEGEAFAASGWRNFAPFFSASKVSSVPGWNYFPTVGAQGYLWSYGTGGGSYYTCDGIGSSDDFVTNDIQSIFTMFLGSYFGDWDNESNFLRAPLGSATYGLTAAWAGRPHWFFHHMALGETIGYSTRLTQNNGSGGLYAAQNQGSRMAHVALMGDPTLRMHPVIPPSNFKTAPGSSGVVLSWTASSDSDLQGYHIYRAESSKGPFTRLTSETPIAATSYVDAAGSSRHTYMVRAIKLEQAASGSYLNPSQGIFAGANSSGTIQEPASVAVPVPPASLSIIRQLQELTLSWIDTSSNETGFRVERKTEATGTYARIADVTANTTSFKDSGLFSGTTYFYRIAAFNSAGTSAPSNEAGATVESRPSSSGPAQAAFVRMDTATRGNWINTYGNEGYHVMGNAAKIPSYAILTSNGEQDYVWKESTSDSRALQKVVGSDRIASCWYNDPGFTTEINFIDGKTHRLSLYCLDWDTTARSQTVELLDANSGALLDRQTLTGFNGGAYLVWDLKGNVIIRFNKLSGYNAVLMGIFFDPAGTQLVNSVGGGSSANLSASSAIFSGGKFQLRVAGGAGQKFKIQASTNCVEWTQISEITLQTSTYDFVDSTASNFPTRFYRAVLVP
jgi:fibronectin type 3 domain-containing protein